MVAYGATKAFDMVMAEALWAELHDQGVDVLGMVLGLTDTPALRRLMVERGQLASVDEPVSGAASAATVAAGAIANLGNGPTWIAGDVTWLEDGVFNVDDLLAAAIAQEAAQAAKSAS